MSNKSIQITLADIEEGKSPKDILHNILEQLPVEEFLLKKGKTQYKIKTADFARDEQGFYMDMARISAIGNDESKMGRISTLKYDKSAIFSIDYLLSILRQYRHCGSETIRLSIGDDTPIRLEANKIISFIAPRLEEED